MIQDLRKGTEEQTNKIHNMLNRDLKNVTNKKAVQHSNWNEKYREDQTETTQKKSQASTTDEHRCKNPQQNPNRF